MMIKTNEIIKRSLYPLGVTVSGDGLTMTRIHVNLIGNMFLLLENIKLKVFDVCYVAI